VKRTGRLALIIATALALIVNVASATEEKGETLGDKLKKLFVRPTPTPTPTHRQKKGASSAASQSSSSSPTVTSDAQAAAELATPSATVAETPTRPSRAGTQYFDAVRPISPPPRRRAKTTRRAVLEPQSTPFPTMTVTSELPIETPASRPVPSLPPLETSAESPRISTPTPSLTVPQTPSPVTMRTPAATGAISIDEISDSANYSPEVRKIIGLALDLTGRNLGYKYVSADPKNGGMDSSGFIYYALSQSGVQDVPRDAREQYIWVRKAGNFQAVLAQRDDTFELDGLKPGDLLFWASKYGISREPDIVQTMIYLGRDKNNNQRLMIGASENRSTRGQKKSGVGVFDFRVGRASTPKTKEENAPFFVGYGHIPGIGEE